MAEPNTGETTEAPATEVETAPTGEEEEGDVAADVMEVVDTAVRDSVNSFKDLFKSSERKESNQLFHKMDTDKSKTASFEELSQFIHSNHQLWAMLAVNLDQSPEVATQVATRVAMELATGLKGQEAMDAELTKDQFYEFRMKYILDPAGSQEFFHRAVFASYDADNNNVLDEEELGEFLDIFYKSGSIFTGDIRLPPKDKLKQLFLEKLDTDNNRKLHFDTVRTIISGQAKADMGEEIAAAVEEEEERLRKEAEEKARKEAEEKARKEAEERARKEAEAAAKKAEEERMAAEAAAKKAEGERLNAEAATQNAEQGQLAAEAEGGDTSEAQIPAPGSGTKPTSATAFTQPPPMYAQKTKKKEFSFFQYIMDMFMPPQQHVSTGQNQLVVKESFCVIL